MYKGTHAIGYLLFKENWDNFFCYFFQRAQCTRIPYGHIQCVCQVIHFSRPIVLNSIDLNICMWPISKGNSSSFHWYPLPCMSRMYWKHCHWRWQCHIPLFYFFEEGMESPRPLPLNDFSRPASNFNSLLAKFQLLAYSPARQIQLLAQTQLQCTLSLIVLHCTLIWTHGLVWTFPEAILSF